MDTREPERILEELSRLALDAKLVRMRAIATEIASLPIFDTNSPEAMLYDEFGLPVRPLRSPHTSV